MQVKLNSLHDLLIRNEKIEGGVRKKKIVKKLTQQKPLISIVTVVLNGEKFIEQTILSIIQQKCKNFEYIIIDGKSNDNTIEILKKYSNSIDYWLSESDNGIYAGMNKGVKHALGEWIIFINADDFLWSDTVVDRIIKELKKVYIETNVVYGKTMLISEGGKELFPLGEPWEDIKIKFMHVMSIPHPSVLHRTILFKKNGLFDESFIIAGDYELLLRELKSSEALFLPQLITGMRQGGFSNRSENTLKSLFEVRRAKIKNGIYAMGIIWLISILKVYMRTLLWKIFGEKITRKILDIGRRMIGLKPCWTVETKS